MESWGATNGTNGTQPSQPSSSPSSSPPPWCVGQTAVGPSSKDIFVQLVISATLGLSAFVGFCIIRPRWTSLYAARRRRHDASINLPALPDSFLGWLPALFKVKEEQVLAAAGLDAFVFLSFFKMSMRLFATMLVFSAVVLVPIHEKFDRPNLYEPELFSASAFRFPDPHQFLALKKGHGDKDQSWDWSYLWAYLAFTWFFSGLTLWFMDAETTKIIKIRQDYLGTQSTITDRTFRLVGIPLDLRSEEQVKEFVENLEIGEVHSVTLCRKWKEIDDLMAKRQIALQRLEEHWTAHLGQRPTSVVPANLVQGSEAPIQNDGDDIENHPLDESTRLLGEDNVDESIVREGRPTLKIRHGFLKLRTRKTDALDYYEEKLRRIDEKILEARKKDFLATNMAFVTMDSIAACQMAVQALIDPRPGQLLAKPAPAPSDVVWKNTYAPWYKRRLRSWIITILVTVLSIIWLIPVAALAQLVSICNIAKVSKPVADALERHEITKALVQTGVPTLVVSLLNALVPYLYDYLSNHQGMVSQGDVELSVISKNFFFTFFNIFVVYAVSGSAALSDFWSIIRDSFSDTQMFATKLASAIETLNNFYLNFIMLQGLGLFPFKLLQFGSVSLYPMYRIGAKTPRDYANLLAPNYFNYGFYLPTSMLVFILCLVYSVLPGSYLVLLLGLCYFGLGYVTYKYQLLYSMEQSQHATGRAWPMICQRIIVGLLVFQIAMIGILLLRKMFFAAALIGPLLILTIWYLFHYRRRFTPLTKFIALRSIKRHTDPGPLSNPDDDTRRRERQATRLTRRMSTIDEDREKGMVFMNPNMITPLEQPWIYKERPPALSPRESVDADTSMVQGLRVDPQSSPDTPGPLGRQPFPGVSNNNGSASETSSFSLGDTHVWRENGSNQV